VAWVADKSQFNQQGQHVHGPQYNADQLRIHSTDAKSIADGIALDRQRRREKSVWGPAWQRYEQKVAERRQKIENSWMIKIRNRVFLVFGFLLVIALPVLRHFA
jgi:hypothetical protein